MKRVHGEKIIKRRTTIEVYNDYHKYKEQLREDFNHICGYCGKDAHILKEDFQIDHFVPKKLDESRKNDYSNLVYSCRVCNRRKWDIWPTNDVKICNNGKEGFIDPATDEFDKHLYRDDCGSIVPYSDVGKYMCEIFKFKIRPIKVIWKATELYNKQIELAKLIDKKRDEASIEEYKAYFRISEEVRKLLDFLYIRR